MMHPDLPDQPISVPAQAVPHHRAAGWVLVEEPEPETSADTQSDTKAAEKSPSASATTGGDAAPESAPDTAPRRRASKEEQK